MSTYCEKCAKNNGGVPARIYTNGEERCTVCRIWLVPYLGGGNSSAATASKTSYVNNLNTGAPAINQPVQTPTQTTTTIQVKPVVTPATTSTKNSVGGSVTGNNATTRNSTVASGVNSSANSSAQPATANTVTANTATNSTVSAAAGKTPARNIKLVSQTVNNSAISNVGTVVSNNTIKQNNNSGSVVENAFANHNIIGLYKIRRELENDFAKWNTEEFKKAISRPAKENRTLSKMNFLIDGDEVTGKTEIAIIVTEILYMAGIRSNSEPVKIPLKQFESAMGKDEDLDDLFKDYKGKTVLIDNSLDEAFMAKDGKVSADANAINDILNALDHLNGDVTLIFELSPELKDDMFFINQRCSDYFYQLSIGKYSDEELLALAKKRIVDEQNYKMTDSAMEQLKNRIKTTSFDGYSQGRFVVDIFDSARKRLEERLKSCSSTTKEDRYTFTEADVQGRFFDRAEAERILDEINAKTGQEGLKAYAKKQFKLACKNDERMRKGQEPLTADQPNFILDGEAGVGKTTSFKLLAKLLKVCGLISDDEPYIVSVAELQTSAVGGTPEVVRKVFAKAKGKLLVIDEAYTLLPKGDISGNYGQEVVDTITNELGNPNKDIVVALLGYPGSVDPVLKMNKGMPRRFPNKISLDSYSTDEMVDIFVKHVNKYNFTIEDDAKPLVYSLINSRRRKEDFGNAGGVINIADDIMAANTSDRNVIGKSELLELINESPGSNLDELLNELGSYIGIGEAKAFVKNLALSIKGREKQRAAGILVKEPSSYNMVFTGPPGTGKTTICRLVGRILSELGIVQYADKFIEVDGADFIAGYIGQTEERVRSILNEARGGIIYIDEFYNMVNGTCFGDSAINTFCKAIDATGKNLIVIISGYEDKVKECISKNPGLKSRFPFEVRFEAYSEDELWEIFKKIIGDNNHICDASEAFEHKVREFIVEKMKDPEFGNGRAMRNLAEDCISNLQTRIAMDDDFSVHEMNIIRTKDIPEVA